MAAKAKEKKEKGKKGKHKGEKGREEKTVEKAALPAAQATAPDDGQGKAKSADGGIPHTSTDDAILDAVIECVARGGIEGLTTRRIAAQAGVNEVTLFRRFGNKEALLEAVFAREAARIRASAVQYSGNLEADLARVVNVFSDALVRRAGVLPILMEAAQRRSDVRTAAQHSLSAFGEVADVLARYMEEGRLQREPPAQVLTALVGPLVFGAVLGGIGGPRTAVDAESHVRGFLYGRAAKQESAKKNGAARER